MSDQILNIRQLLDKLKKFNLSLPVYINGFPCLGVQSWKGDCSHLSIDFNRNYKKSPIGVGTLIDLLENILRTGGSGYKSGKFDILPIAPVWGDPYGESNGKAIVEAVCLNEKVRLYAKGQTEQEKSAIIEKYVQAIKKEIEARSISVAVAQLFFGNIICGMQSFVCLKEYYRNREEEYDRNFKKGQLLKIFRADKTEDTSQPMFFFMEIEFVYRGDGVQPGYAVLGISEVNEIKWLREHFQSQSE